uniref:Uncharacterized protein n=1 Tax=Heterorhabditis bacteriophora TaxID=37862 RepID=A0A1I7WE11_HETBA
MTHSMTMFLLRKSLSFFRSWQIASVTLRLFGSSPGCF